MKRLNGIKLKHRKNTENCATVDLPMPAKVRIPMSMTMGAPCQPLVKVGDEVKVGQKIGDCDRYMSVPVHSSVSGTVTGISELLQVSGRVCKCVDIETDGEQTLNDGSISTGWREHQVTHIGQYCLL